MSKRACGQRWPRRGNEKPPCRCVNPSASVRPTDGRGIQWTKSDKGGMQLVLKTAKSSTSVRVPKLTDDQVADKVEKAKTGYKAMKSKRSKVLSTLKFDLTLQLPGDIQEINNFKKLDKGVQIGIDGKQLMAAMDKFFDDDQALEKHIRSGRKDEDMPENFNEMLFGSKGDVMARVGGDLKPLFDYQTEMKKAKAGQDELLKKLGVEIEPRP